MQSNSSNFNLDSFIEFLYEGLEGYVYLAAKDPADPDDWKQEFFVYPTEVDKLKATIKGASKSHEVYISPALYSIRKADREHVKCSNVVWTEFDGNAPTEWQESKGRPSLTIQSSSEQNLHCYWRLSEPCFDISALEDVNRRLTYNMGADSSAWDANQVLRPPETFNYKRGLPVRVFEFDDTNYDINVFDSMAPAPAQLETNWEITSLPDLNEVILSYSFTPDMMKLMLASTAELKADRSTSLMNLAYGCAQMGMSDNELMAILVHADSRWEKFKHRKDRYKRLAHIITIARNKYPQSEDTDEPFTVAFGFESFLNSEIQIDWVIEGMLMEQGNMLMVGPSGIGKSQITLQFAIHLALGKDFLHYKINRSWKIMFLSLEMGHGELKIFLEEMAKGLTPEEISLLETNLIIIPHGETWHLNTEQGQNELITWIEGVEPEGIMVDSIGSSILGNISSDESIQPFTQFNDRIRKRYGLFTWYIHHMRKVREGAATQDDVYGNQYLLNRSTSSYGILPGKEGTIKVRNFKQRLAAKEKDYSIVRTTNLMFNGKDKDFDEAIVGNIAKSGLGEVLEPNENISPTTAGGLDL